MMKTLLSISSLALLAGMGAQAQSYCVPPPFSTGPFTGILYVSVGEWENASPYDDGYRHFAWLDPVQLTAGESYESKIKAEHTIAGAGFSGNLNYRIWIDWNQDGDFEDNDEEVMTVDYKYYTDTQSATFEVPADAVPGPTRMRVYEDMPVSEGHDAPTPCGYMGSTNPLGQHGEVEDYDIEVLAGEDTTGGEWPVGIAQVSTEAAWGIRNLSGGQLLVNVRSTEQSYRISVSNLLGQEVYTSPQYLPGKSGTLLLNLEEEPSGIYIVQFRSGTQRSSQKVFID